MNNQFKPIQADNIRTTAWKAIQDIRDKDLTDVAMADEYRQAFDSLNLSEVSDPSAQSIVRNIDPLLSWADTPAKRIEVYATALSLTSQIVGGGVGLATYTLSGMARTMGTVALPLLQDLVPQAVIDGQASGPEWSLGQSVGLLRQGRPDLIEYLPQMSYREGYAVTPNDIEQDQATRKRFRQELLDQRSKLEGPNYWFCRTPGGLGPAELEGREVAFLAGKNGTLVEIRAPLQAVNDRRPQFRVAGHDEEFNINEIPELFILNKL